MRGFLSSGTCLAVDRATGNVCTLSKAAKIIRHAVDLSMTYCAEAMLLGGLFLVITLA